MLVDVLFSSVVRHVLDTLSQSEIVLRLIFPNPSITNKRSFTQNSCVSLTPSAGSNSDLSCLSGSARTSNTRVLPSLQETAIVVESE